MRQIVATTATLALLGLLGVAAFVYTGVYDVGADEKHWGVTYRFMEMVRMQSIRAHAADIQTPASLDDQDRVLAGAVHFATHCAICHSAPGAEAEDLAQGMYPEPPA